MEYSPVISYVEDILYQSRFGEYDKGWNIRGRFPARAGDFLVFQNVSTSPEIHPAPIHLAAKFISRC